MVDHYPLFEFPYILPAVKINCKNDKCVYKLLLVALFVMLFDTSTEASAPAVLSLLLYTSDTPNGSEQLPSTSARDDPNLTSSSE